MFVLQLTHIIRPDKLNKDDFKSVAQTKTGVYSDFEHRLLSTYAPYRYGGQPLDKTNRRALLEANQILFNFLVTVDYSAAGIVDKMPACTNNCPDIDENDIRGLTLENKNSGLVAEKIRLLGPLLADLGFPLKLSHGDSPDVIWKLKRVASFALNKAVSLLGMDFTPKFRNPDLYLIKEEVYSPKALYGAIALLLDHFNKYYNACSMFLLGSFMRNHPPHRPPSGMDFRIVVPSLPQQYYSDHLHFAQSLLKSSPITIGKRGQETSIPVVFMLVEKEHFNSFALSDPNSLFSPGHSLLLDGDCAVPELPASVRYKLGNELKLANAFISVINLREALADSEIYLNLPRLKSRRNALRYVRQALEHNFGIVTGVAETPKFPAEKLSPQKTFEALVEANLAMQEILLAYGPYLEAELDH